MSMEMMVRAMKIKVGNPLRKLVLLKLADNASDQGECWPSVPYIAEQCEISERSVQNHIRQLVKDGLVRIEKRLAENGLNRSNVYHITLSGSGANPAPYGAAPAPGGESPAPGGGAAPAPRISHSFESVNEPINGGSAGADHPEQPQADRMDYQKILEIYHAKLPEMPSVQILTDARKRTLRSFWKKFKFTETRWELYLQFIAENCRWMLEDRPNGRGGQWRRKNFDYLITERCYVAVKEGRADDR
ncbi:helix-turn-helix domain-containing protein [Serratia marcescens]|uniref:helix-turn-helix domain-containing protein n=1 Tax=Serratia marcescens TaxID=615 RepID=UPI0018D67114|nr:helix-turn-helix domain-containing protein [Serratia marcescens]MBN5325814.1 helix-turn-helix domain-containing protein [Serratia marcescens]MBN5347526.1 helix-turn-helix domain-containing protein [Serratia marcescens]